VNGDAFDLFLANLLLYEALYAAKLPARLAVFLDQELIPYRYSSCSSSCSSCWDDALQKAQVSVVSNWIGRIGYEQDLTKFTPIPNLSSQTLIS